MPATTAVVSLFNPDENVRENAAVLLSQTDRVVVVDDGSPEDPSAILAELEAMGCTVVKLDENSGIAAALNAGISEALSTTPKPEFILTMDQDSRLRAGYVGALLETAAIAGVSGVRVGMVAPGSVSGLPVRRGSILHGVQLGGEPIQSGLLIPVGVIEQIGAFRENLFIDGVDSEFFLRCRHHGLNAILSDGASLDHALGAQTVATVFGKPVAIRGRTLEIRTAASWRYYYIFRNRVLLTKQYGREYPVWALKGLLADYRHLLIASTLAPGRLRRLVNAAAGVRDGLRGRSGRRPAGPAGV